MPETLGDKVVALLTRYDKADGAADQKIILENDGISAVMEQSVMGAINAAKTAKNPAAATDATVAASIASYLSDEVESESVKFNPANVKAVFDKLKLDPANISGSNARITDALRKCVFDGDHDVTTPAGSKSPQSGKQR